MNIDSIMKELAEYIRMGEQIAATVDGLKDQLKQIMQEQNTDTLTGTEHKATYKAGNTIPLLFGCALVERR